MFLQVQLSELTYFLIFWKPKYPAKKFMTLTAERNGPEKKYLTY